MGFSTQQLLAFVGSLRNLVRTTLATEWRQHIAAGVSSQKRHRNTMESHEVATANTLASVDCPTEFPAATSWLNVYPVNRTVGLRPQLHAAATFVATNRFHERALEAECFLRQPKEVPHDLG